MVEIDVFIGVGDNVADGITIGIDVLVGKKMGVEDSVFGVDLTTTIVIGPNVGIPLAEVQADKSKGNSQK
jgi:hypothetical protein